MPGQIEIGGILVDVIFKDIKNLHLSVHPPSGRVRIAAPQHMDLDTIRVYAISKLDWIRKHQRKLHHQERETQREYIDRESHYLWGQRYLLEIEEAERVPAVVLKHSTILLTVRPGNSPEKRQQVLSAWYRDQLRSAVLPLIAKWEPILGVQSQQLRIRRMKTRWGSCNPRSAAILLNSELAKKPPECVEYIIVHELLHLRVPNHNAVFISLLDHHLPQWRLLRDELNRAPLGHVDWEY